MQMLDRPEPDFARQREEMVEHAIRARGVRSKLVLVAMNFVPRVAFLPAHLREFASEDSPLPIGV
jgi:protein-L-isoaspartate O-methyltransferase